MSKPSKSLSISLATIIAALITGTFGFFAARQTLRVQVSLPDASEETFSIKAASKKIEDLLKRIETLEEQLESKDRKIADLRQMQQDAAANESPPLPANVTQSGDHPSSPFRTRWFQIKVISVAPAPEEIVLLAELEAVRDEAVKFQLRTNGTFVLDHHGNRWGGYTRVEDTLGVFAAPAVELLPGTTVRSRIRFEADVSRSARLPNPKPPFTLIAEETYSQQRIVIEGLETR